MEVIWDNVEVDIGGDETGNFGPREETGTALYQVDTTATISTRENEVSNLPHLSAFVTEEGVCISTNQHLSLFQDTCHKFLLTMEFDCIVDCMTCDEDGEFVVLGDRNGDLHFLDILTQQPLFSRKLAEGGIENEQCFHHICFTPATADGVCELCVVTRDRVFIFGNIQLRLLHEALEEKNLQKAALLKAAIEMKVVETGDVHTESCLSMVLNRQNTLITSGVGSNVLCLWARDDNDNFQQLAAIPDYFTQGSGIKQCFLTDCGRLIITLDLKGRLGLWDVHTMTMLRQWKDKIVKQFLVLEAGDELNNTTKVKLVLLTQATNSHSEVVICELPRLTPVYTIQLSEHVYLAQCATQQESILVLEGVDDTESHTGGVSTIRVRCLTEAQPEIRLSRILHKKQFDEAEKFAKLFNLDVELVFNVKANHLVEQLSPWNIANYTEEDLGNFFKELKLCLEKITDDAQVVHICVSATPPTLQDTHELLNIAKKRMSSTNTTNAKRNESICVERHVLLTQVLDAMHRLATFQVAFGAHKFSGEKWESFLKAPMLRYLLQRLCQGHISVAFSIWRQHQAEFEENFNKDKLDEILSSIPEQTPSADLKPWLANDLIPYIIRIFPEGLHQVAAWLEQRVRNMELLEKNGWPANAMQMSDLLSNTCMSVSQSNSERGMATPREFATQTCNLSVGYSQILAAQDDAATSNAFVRLHTLSLRLKDLVSLHTKYNCCLSLAEYLQETTESLTYRMLDRVVAIELIPASIEKVVRPYMKEHNLREDRMLFQYIGDLAERAGKVVSVLGEAPWESKAIAVIACIQNPEYKCRAILDAMKRAYIPWSTDMNALVQEGLALNHPRVRELKEQCRLIELRKMLTTYDLRNFNMGESSNAETLVYYILSKDWPTAIKDALEVVDAYAELEHTTAYVFRIKFLVSNNRLGEALTLLEELSDEESNICAHRFITYTKVLLGDPVIFDKEEIEIKKKQCTLATCHIVRFLLKKLQIKQEKRKMLEQNMDVAWIEELEELHVTMKNIYYLQVEFNEYMSYYNFDEMRHKVLERYIQYFYTHQNEPCDMGTDPDRKPPKRKQWNFEHLYRLGELLHFPRDILRGQLARLAAEKKQVDMAILLAEELFDDSPGEETAVVLYDVALTLTDLIANNCLPETYDFANLPKKISDLANKAVTWCPADIMIECLDLSRKSTQAYNISRQCESGDYGASVQKTSEVNRLASGKRDPFKEWTFEPLFSEDGFVMESDIALPAVYKYNIASTINDEWPCDDSEESSVIEQISQPAQELIQYLRENMQIELALAYSLDAVRSYMLHLTLHNMGFADEFEKRTKAQKLEENQASMEIQTGINTIHDLTEMLLKKLFQQSSVDTLQAVGYLCNLPQKRAVERLQKFKQSAGHNYKKVRDVAQVGINVAELCHLPKVKEVCQDQETNALWGYKLAKIKVSFKEAFNAPISEKKNLLPRIVQNESSDVQMIVDYCKDFSLDLDQALFLYISHLLVPARDKPSGDFMMNINLCHQANEHIECTFLVEKLKTILELIDPYDYERISFVLTQLSNVANTPETEKSQKLLCYLMPNVRVSSPSQYEINYNRNEEDDQLMSAPLSLSKLSKERLPFHALLRGDPWKIISPELNESTVSVWLHVANILRLSQDQVICTTVQNLVQKHITDKHAEAAGHKNVTRLDKSQCSWSDESVDHEFFAELKSLLIRVKNCEMAMACTRWVVMELPMGAEKVMALKDAVYLTHVLKEACPEESPERKKAEEAYKKLYSFYRRLSTEQVLFQHGLGEEELVNMSSSPEKLIRNLYEHHSINKRSAGSRMMDKLPDIHKAVDKIAAINRKDKLKIQMSLIEQWLPSIQQNAMQELDMTMNVTIDVTMNAGSLDETTRTEDEISQDDINLRRVAYLLQQGNLESNALFLLNSAHTNDQTKLSHMCRVRALRCVFSLVDGQTITKLTNQPSKFCKEFLQTLMYLVEFERLHISQSVQTFQTCNKEGLVKGIWRNHSHQHRAVRLVADICLDYGIYDVQLWNSILQKLVAFNMLEYLGHVLVCVSGIPELWQVSCIQRVWKAVLISPLQSVVAPLSTSQVEQCANSVKLLLRCPLLHDLDAQLFCKQLCRLELPELAFSCALLIPHVDKREHQLDSLLEDGGHLTILKKMTEWNEAGKPLPLEQQILTCIYEYIDREREYNSIEGTSYMKDLAQYLVDCDRLSSLLSYAITHDRLPQASVLMSLYIQTHPDQSFISQINNQQPSQKLRLFCNLQGILGEVEDHLPPVEEDPDITVTNTTQQNISIY